MFFMYLVNPPFIAPVPHILTWHIKTHFCYTAFHCIPINKEFMFCCEIQCSWFLQQFCLGSDRGVTTQGRRRPYSRSSHVPVVDSSSPSRLLGVVHGVRGLSPPGVVPEHGRQSL